MTPPAPTGTGQDDGSNNATTTADDDAVAAVEESTATDSSDASQSRTTRAQKHWAQLRTMTRVQSAFRSSLRKEEHELLSFIHDQQQQDDKELHVSLHCEHRKDLTKLIASSRSTLSQKEAEYLRKLIASPDVSSETVARARQSIVVISSSTTTTTTVGTEVAPFMLSDVSIPEDDANEQDAETRPPLRHQRDASFRKELWSVDSKKILSQQNEQKAKGKGKEEKKEEQEKKPEQQQQKQQQQPQQEQEQPWSGFFGLFTGGWNQQGKQQETKDSMDAADDEDDDDDFVPYSILGTSADDDDCHPHVLTPPIMEQLRKHLPYVVSNDNFWLRYSMLRDGASMRCLVDRMRNSARSVVAIETMQGDVLGAFCSSPWMPRGKRYFGSGEAFLWRMEKSRYTPCQTVDEQVALESNISVFKWSGENRNVQRLEQHDGQLIMGGGGPDNNDNDDNADGEHDDHGSGLVIYPELESGFSNPCLTFKSPSLPPSAAGAAAGDSSSFEIANIEVWTLSPVTTVDQAEQVELGRRFIFDNSDFIEA